MTDDDSIHATRGELTLKNGVDCTELFGGCSIETDHVEFNGETLSLEIEDDRTTTDATAAVRVKLSSGDVRALAEQLVADHGWRVVPDDGTPADELPGHGTARTGPDGGDTV